MASFNHHGVSLLLFWISLEYFASMTVLGYYLEDDKRQDLVPFPRVGRTLWTTVDDWTPKRQELVPFPRVGKRQGLIPFPRIGRELSPWEEPDMDGELPPSDPGEILDSGGVAFWLVPYKRGAFVPRIGRRKKRSTTSNHEVESNNLVQNSNNGATGQSPNRSMSPYQLAEWIQGHTPENFDYDRNQRQLIPAPRVGRRSGEATIHLRSAFVPRLGKKRSGNSQIDDFQDDHDEQDDEFNDDGDLLDKRGAFTPRIGRTPAFTPRIGRRSDNSRVKITGRAFTPRIGRSSGAQNDKMEAPKSSNQA